MPKIFFLFCLLSFFLTAEVSYAKSILWLDGKLPPDSQSEGLWIWDNDKKHDNIASHASGISQGMQSHSFVTHPGVEVNSGSKIIQYVFIDAEKPPSGIMIIFSVSEGDDISTYWEQGQEVFKGMYITSWYMGTLPDKGEWRELIIDCRELDIENLRLNGASFITSDGRAWWGRTVIVND
ncbi:MAG: hypothetical protein ABH843_00300 [Candidatus Omnitrophota bacterium]